MTEHTTTESRDESTGGGTAVPTDSVDAALSAVETEGLSGYNYAYLDEIGRAHV